MLSIVIPCFNEERAISDVAKLIRKRMPLLKSHFDDVEVVAVDDGSTDNSVEILKSHSDIYKTILNKRGVGYGGAIKVGVSHSVGRFVGIMDMDATYDPLDFVTLIKKKKKSEVLLVGNRIHKTSALSGMRFVGNSLFKSMFRFALNSQIVDPSCGIRIFDRTWLEQHLPRLPDDLSFAFATSVMCAVQKKPFVQEDVKYYTRVGESKLQEIRDGVRFLSVAWKITREKSQRHEKSI